jgi:hypothetical protein
MSRSDRVKIDTPFRCEHRRPSIWHRIILVSWLLLHDVDLRRGSTHLLLIAPPCCGFGPIVVADHPAPTEPFPIRPCIVGRLSSPCSDALCVCHRHVAFENNLVSMLQLLLKVSVASQHFAIIVITSLLVFSCTKLLYYFHAFIRVHYYITPYWLTLNERSPDSFIYFYFFFLIRHSFFLNLTLLTLIVYFLFTRTCMHSHERGYFRFRLVRGTEAV